MALSSFLAVIGGDDGGSGIGWRGRRRRGARVGGGGSEGGGGGDGGEEGRQVGGDEEDGRAVAPGDNVERVEEEEEADERDPDGAAKGAKEAELIAGGAVVGEARAGVGHPADEEPD